MTVHSNICILLLSCGCRDLMDEHLTLASLQCSKAKFRVRKLPNCWSAACAFHCTAKKMVSTVSEDCSSAQAQLFQTTLGWLIKIQQVSAMEGSSFLMFGKDHSYCCWRGWEKWGRGVCPNFSKTIVSNELPCLSDSCSYLFLPLQTVSTLTWLVSLSFLTKLASCLLVWNTEGDFWWD